MTRLACAAALVALVATSGCQHARALTPTIDLEVSQIGNAESQVEVCDHQPMDLACSMNVTCTTVTMKTTTATAVGAVLGAAITAAGMWASGGLAGLF